MLLDTPKKHVNKYTILILGSITFFICVGFLYYLLALESQNADGTQVIQAEELRTNEDIRSSFAMAQLGSSDTAWADNHFLLLDVRSTELYDASHLEGARSVPISYLGGSTIDPAAKVVIYSEDAQELQQAETILQQLGVTSIYSLNDPLTEYQEQGYGVYVQP